MKTDELSVLNASSKVEIAGACARLDEREKALLFERSERQAVQAALDEARERLAKLEVEIQAQNAAR